MGLMANPYQQYKRQDVMMASPIELIVMLYTGCIKQLKLARMSIEKMDYEQTNVCMQKAQDIIVELSVSLDFSYEISKELMDLYKFILSQIIEINMSKDIEKLNKVIKIVENLRGTWIQVQKQTSGNTAGYQLAES